MALFEDAPLKFMKNLPFIISGIIVITAAASTTAQSQFSGYGFRDNGAFHFSISGTAEVEASHDLKTWSKYATVTQETALEDMTARRADRRFYRVRGASGPSSIIGFSKVTVPAGKLAVLGNAFGTALRLDTPEARHGAFGVTNPAVKVSLYTNGNFAAHTFNASTATWEPPLRAIRPREGFALQNTGSTPVTIRFAGEVHQGRVQIHVPAGSSLVVPPVPAPTPLGQLLSSHGREGTQIFWFDEQAQTYRTSGFTSLDNKWEPALPELQLGRAFILKTPQEFTLTNTFQSAPAR